MSRSQTNYENKKKTVCLINSLSCKGKCILEYILVNFLANKTKEQGNSKAFPRNATFLTCVRRIFSVLVFSC